jgi:inhibitor of the pro-sigma K processing machinery
MSHTIWLWLFIGSSLAIFLVVMRGRSWQWVWGMALNVVVAGVLFYFLEVYTNFHVPMNEYTMLTVAILGLPGLGMLIGLKLIIF